MGSSTEMDFGGLTLVTNAIKVGATAPGQSGTALSSTELALLDTVTAGAVTAGKVLTVDGSSNLSGTINLTGAVTLTSPRHLVTTATSNGTAISNSGMTVISTTGGTLHTLAAPVAGIEKVLVSTNATTVDVTVQATTDITINGGHNGLVFDGANELIMLMGESATSWRILSNPGTVGVAASS